MFNLFLLWFDLLLSLFRSRRNLLLENLVLRQQLAVDTRRAPSWILPRSSERWDPALPSKSFFCRPSGGLWRCHANKAQIQTCASARRSRGSQQGEPVSIQTRIFAPTSRSAYRTMPVSAMDVFASMPRVVDAGLCFQEGSCDEYGRAQEMRLPGVRWHLSCEGGIAHRVWMATSYAVEITGGQNFGEAYSR